MSLINAIKTNNPQASVIMNAYKLISESSNYQGSAASFYFSKKTFDEILEMHQGN